MTDQAIVIAAIEEAQRILAEYIEPGQILRLPDVTINRLLSVLGRRVVVSALHPQGGIRIASGKIKHIRRASVVASATGQTPAIVGSILASQRRVVVGA